MAIIYTTRVTGMQYIPILIHPFMWKTPISEYGLEREPDIMIIIPGMDMASIPPPIPL